MLLAFLTATALAGSPYTFNAPQPGYRNYDLEELYRDRDYTRGLALTYERLKTHPEDTDLYWMAMRFMYELGELNAKTEDRAARIARYQEMIRLSEAGLARKPGDPHLSFALGLSQARLGTARGVLASLSLADDVEKNWRLTADSGFTYTSLGGDELLPCHAMQALGVFYRLVPESALVQAIAGTRGDLVKSVDYLRKADACVPGEIQTMKEFGASLVCYGQEHKDPAATREGITVWSRALAIKPTRPLDPIDLRHTAELLANPGLACGYSRDGQQERDEAKIKR